MLLLQGSHGASGATLTACSITHVTPRVSRGYDQRTCKGNLHAPAVAGTHQSMYKAKTAPAPMTLLPCRCQKASSCKDSTRCIAPGLEADCTSCFAWSQKAHPYTFNNQQYMLFCARLRGEP